LLQINAVVCGSANSANSIAVVVWFPWTTEVLAAEAEPADSGWKVIHRGSFVRSMLPFQGKLYATTFASREVLQRYIHHRSRALGWWLLVFQTYSATSFTASFSSWSLLDLCCSLPCIIHPFIEVAWTGRDTEASSST
jgi:hypothetical protein